MAFQPMLPRGQGFLEKCQPIWSSQPFSRIYERRALLYRNNFLKNKSCFIEFFTAFFKLFIFRTSTTSFHAAKARTRFQKT